MVQWQWKPTSHVHFHLFPVILWSAISMQSLILLKNSPNWIPWEIKVAIWCFQVICFDTQLLHLNHDGRGKICNKDRQGEQEGRWKKVGGSTLWLWVHQVHLVLVEVVVLALMVVVLFIRYFYSLTVVIIGEEKYVHSLTRLIFVDFSHPTANVEWAQAIVSIGRTEPIVTENIHDLIMALIYPLPPIFG